MARVQFGSIDEVKPAEQQPAPAPRNDRATGKIIRPPGYNAQSRTQPSGMTRNLTNTPEMRAQIDTAAFDRNLDPYWYTRDYAPTRMYWNDPGRLARFYNVLKTQPADWEAPPWMEPDKVAALYEYFKQRNDNKPWYQWTPLADDDPVMDFMHTMAEPPADFMMPTVDDYFINRWEQQAKGWAAYTDEVNAYRQQNQGPTYRDLIKSWPELPAWQRIMLTIFSAQPGLADRPEWTRGTAALFQGAMAAVGAGGIATALSGGNPLVGVGVGGVVLAGTAYQAFSGKQIPVLTELLTVLDLGAIAAERAIGVGKQAFYDESFEEVMKNFGAAWKAADLTYESQMTDLVNMVAVLAGDEPAGPGEVWQFQKGYIEPQQLQGTRGSAALDEYRERLIAGEDATMLYLETVDRFGFSGTLNDFIMQTALDPANVAPFLMGRAGASTAKALGQQRLGAVMEAGVGNPVVDIAPFGTKWLAKWITGGKESQGLLGSIETYKRYVQGGVTIEGLAPARANELTAFEKWMGGLTREGELKVLQPQKGKQNFVQYLTSMTREAQARTYMNLAEDQVGNLVGWLGRGDPEQMVQVVERMAQQANPGEVYAAAEGVNDAEMTPPPTPPLQGEGRTAEEMAVEAQAGEVEEGLIYSPAVATIATGIRQAVTSGKPKELLTSWHAGERQRGLLLRIAKLLGEDPGKVLQQIEENSDVVWQRIAGKEGIEDITAMVADANALKDTMGVFMGRDPIPWHPDEFQAILTKTIIDDMRGFAAERFGVKPESAAVRMTNVMKGVQSLLLLGFNPGYFVNNAVNNMVTRAAQGVFGFMTPKQVNRLMERLEMKPARMDVGVGAAGEAVGGDTNLTSVDPISKAAQGDDLIARAQRQVNRMNEKLGIFSRLSSAVERSESRNAYAIGIRQMYKKLWKRDTGFQRMPKGMETMLEQAVPGITERIYAAVEAGMNMGEIEEAIYGSVIKRQINAVKREAAEAIARNVDPERRAVDPAVMEELVDSLGITDALEETLARAETPEDVDQAFDAFERRVEEYVDEIAGQEMENLVEDVRVRMQAEGTQVVLPLFVEMQVKMEHRWLQHFSEWEETMSEAARLNPSQKDALIQAQRARDTARWNRINTFELQVMKAIIEGLDFDKDLSRVFIEQLLQRHQIWNEFYRERNRRYREYFERSRNMDWSDRDPTWKQMTAEMMELYRKTNERVNRTQESMDAAFAEMMEAYLPGSRERTLDWRKRVMDAQQQRQKEMTDFRAYIDDSNLDGSQRRAEWTSFVTRVYNQAISRIRQVEVEGAAEVLGRDAETRGRGDAETVGADADLTTNTEAVPTGTTPEQSVEGRSSGRLIAEMLPEYRDVRAGRTVGVQDLGHALNIINRYNGEGTTYTDILTVPVDVARRSLDAWRDAHRHETVGHVVQMRLAVDEIVREADRTRREALLRSRGMQGRKETMAQLRRQFPEVSEAELAAAMLMVDERARLWAREQGLHPSEATRDAYYASRFGGDEGIVTGQETPSLAQQITGKSDLERSDALLNMQPVEVVSPKYEGDVNNIRELARDIYGQFANTIVRNKNDNREIRFRSRAIRKILGHISQNMWDAKVVGALPEIIENGVLLFTSEARTPRDLGTYHHYGTRVMIDGEEAVVRCIVREENGNLFYDSHVTLRTEIEKILSGTSSGSLTPATPGKNLVKDILLQWLQKVNKESTSGCDSKFREKGG